MMSPGRAPRRRTRCSGETVPSPVLTSVSSWWASRSPPTSSAPNIVQQSRAPTIIPESRSGLSRPTARSICPGVAPMLARSESVTATAIQPICQSVIPAGKSVISWSISVLATRRRPFPQGMTAQSSSSRSGSMIVPINRCRPRSSTATHLLLPLAPGTP